MQENTSECRYADTDLDELLEIMSLMSKKISGETISKGDHSMGEVMLGQPRYDKTLLHVRPCRHVHNQIPHLLPVSKATGDHENPSLDSL